MTSSLAVILDMDGVVVDTLDSLYKGYLAILANYGIDGNKAEFNELNGPSLDEIVDILSVRYAGIPSKEILKQQFIEQHSQLYLNAKLCSGALEFLNYCKNKQINVALATSSSKKNVEVIFERYSLKEFFSHIISGDDVINAKPHPEIYELAAKPLKSKVIISLDDSYLGVESALQAGLISVQFCQDNPKLNPHSASQVRCFHDFINLISQPMTWFNRYSTYFFNVVKFDFTPYLNEIDLYWESHKHPSMFNGPAILCSGVTGNTLNVIHSDFKTVFYIQNHASSILSQQFFLIGVSGFVFTEHKILVATRAGSVAQYPNYLECPPSGGFESELRLNEYQNQLIKELSEETMFTKESIKQINTHGIILDTSMNQLDILSSISIKQTNLQHFADNDEYQNLEMIDFDSFKKIIKTNPALPECRMIGELLGELT